MGSACFALRRVSRVVSASVARACYFATVHSLLQYGAEIWGRSADWLRAFRMQKRAVRAIAKIPQNVSARPYFKSLGILTLPALVIFQVAVYARMNLDSYTKGSSVHDHHTRGRDKLRAETRSLTKTSKITHVMGPTVYNKLPEPVISAPNLTSFKRQLKHWLIEQTFYSYDEFALSKT